ncbi:helix-turn-helix domain-containing protein [Candidatus Bipolaricaulota bacterium]|nr:helix-turn-helix domain-containing protein [Candidatus Bipolaricaulota bacterium]
MIFEGVELPGLLTIEKAAAVLGIDIEAVKQLIASGEVDAVQTRGQVRIMTSSIEDRRGQQTTSRSNQESTTL